MVRTRRVQSVYRTFEVSFGWCAAARTKGGLCSLILPVGSAEEAERLLPERAREFERSPTALRDVVAAVRYYFNGWRTEFADIRLDLSAGTEFQRRVWSIVRKIPYGEVRTYRWIALEMGRPGAARAIGQAVGANPAPLIVPCHRIVSADGTLGGFSAARGVELKTQMLELERVPMSDFEGKRRVMAVR